MKAFLENYRASGRKKKSATETQKDHLAKFTGLRPAMRNKANASPLLRQSFSAMDLSLHNHSSFIRLVKQRAII